MAPALMEATYWKMHLTRIGDLALLITEGPLVGDHCPPRCLGVPVPRLFLQQVEVIGNDLFRARYVEVDATVITVYNSKPGALKSFLQPIAVEHVDGVVLGTPLMMHGLTEDLMWVVLPNENAA